jgi:hypothetical protein
MRGFLMILLISWFIACNNSGNVTVEVESLGKKVDTTLDKALNSETADSIRSKGGKILEDVKTKGGEIWDSTKSKGGRLLDKGEKEWNKGTKEDSSN